jgi:hypothetical protein
MFGNPARYPETATSSAPTTLRLRLPVGGGSIKFGATLDAVIRNNYVRENDDAGNWWDVNCKDVVIEADRVLRSPGRACSTRSATTA